MHDDPLNVDNTPSALKSLFDWFLFSSLFIACCAVLMVYQTEDLLELNYYRPPFYLFVFFSTICSYNFHWYFTPASQTELLRARWTQQNKKLHFVLYLAGLIGAGWFAFQLREHWFWLAGSVFLTFLYSAPKVPIKPFTMLRKIAIGKTIFLAFVWMYVTSFLPVVISGSSLDAMAILFCASRFFLIYSICIIFDYRDREQDRTQGIKSMITFFDERGIDRLFHISLLLFTLLTILLFTEGIDILTIGLLLIPAVLLLLLYRYAKRTFSDYLYYFVLDGLMMCSALFTSFLSIYLFLKT